MPFRYVLKRAVFRSRLASRAVAELRERGGLSWPPVHQRVAVVAAMASARTALETEPGSAAARELSALWRAVRVTPVDLVARRPARLVAAGWRA